MDINQKILPYFPLGVFLLPGEDIPLRIFEPRYIQLITEAKEEGMTFALPFVKDDEILDYGCEVKLQQVVAENPNGRMVVTIEGVSVVRIKSFAERLSDKLYGGGTVEVLPGPRIITNHDLLSLIDEYRSHFDKKFLIEINEYALNIFDIAVALNLSSDEKYKLVFQTDPDQQENYLITQMRYIMLIRKQEMQLNNEFGLN